MAQLTTAPDVSGSGEDKNQLKGAFPKHISWLSGLAPRMCALDHELTHVAESDYAVLITGESGTGKTTVAKIVHQRSKRAAAQIVEINCAAIPDALLESELFGFERGAFTGATMRKRGLFEVANNGTLLLDEIGELKPELQAKLLKVIDDHKIRRLGALVDIECNVRLIAATSRNLQAMIANAGFREDLYYRLAVLQIDVPPLRERSEDVDKLVHARLCLEQLSLGKSEPFHVDRGALKELREYCWPGNIRQLQNVIARLACYADNNTISLDAVRAELARFKHLDSETIILPKSCSALFAGESLTQFSTRVRGAVIEAVKARERGNMSLVAQRLNVDRSSLLRIERKIKASREPTNGRRHPVAPSTGRTLKPNKHFSGEFYAQRNQQPLASDKCL